MEKEMQRVFDAAIIKAKIRSNKKGNTDEPWKDFTINRLCDRLADEIIEWNESGNRAELLDIINFAAFIYLAYEHQTYSTKKAKQCNAED